MPTITMVQSPSMIMTEPNDLRLQYEADADIDIQEVGEEIFDGIAVHDISFRGTGGNRIDAYLVTPIVGRSLPGVLFVHPLPGSRRSFLDEALKLADLRICSILVDAPWARGMDWARQMGNPQHDRAEYIDAVKDLRRSFDVLTAQPAVNKDRLGYVGHSLGALCGAVLTGIDRRAKAYVLMSGTSSFSDVVTANVPGMSEEEVDNYRLTVSDVDPVRFLPRAAPAKVMFQMGRSEEYFSLGGRQSFADAASEPKVVQWYDAGHALNEQARQDRDKWLAGELFR